MHRIPTRRLTCFFAVVFACATSISSAQSINSIQEPIAVDSLSTPVIEEPTVAGSSAIVLPECSLADNPPDLFSDSNAKRRWIPLPEGLFPPLTGKTPEEHRHLGLGTPLNGPMSWNALSHSAGFYVGGLDGAQSVAGHLTHQWGTTFGLRFGLDYDYHWGIEKRFGFASLDTRDANSTTRDQTELEFGDVDLYYYPWGDSRVRPYILGGLGLSRYNYEDVHGHLERYLLTSPFGIGVKRLVNNGLNFRVEIMDNLLLGRGTVGSMNNMSISTGAEFRYKGLHWR